MLLLFEPELPFELSLLFWPPPLPPPPPPLLFLFLVALLPPAATLKYFPRIVLDAGTVSRRITKAEVKQVRQLFLIRSIIWFIFITFDKIRLIVTNPVFKNCLATRPSKIRSRDDDKYNKNKCVDHEMKPKVNNVMDHNAKHSDQCPETAS